MLSKIVLYTIIQDAENVRPLYFKLSKLKLCEKFHNYFIKHSHYTIFFYALVKDRMCSQNYVSI